MVGTVTSMKNLYLPGISMQSIVPTLDPIGRQARCLPCSVFSWTALWHRDLSRKTLSGFVATRQLSGPSSFHFQKFFSHCRCTSSTYVLFSICSHGIAPEVSTVFVNSQHALNGGHYAIIFESAHLDYVLDCLSVCSAVMGSVVCLPFTAA
jgi:hypothetical protein